MKHLTLLLLTSSACWGAGPTPELPDGVDIVYSVPPAPDVNCGETVPYIGDVSIGGGYLFAALMPYAPANDCNNPNNGGQTQVDVPIARIPLQGTAGTVTEYAGGTAKDHLMATRVAAASTRGAWVNSPDTAMRLNVYSDPPVTRQLNFTQGYYLPYGFVADDTYGFVVATSQGTNRDVNYPSYPSGTDVSGLPASTGWRIRWDDDATPLSGVIQMTIPTDTSVIGGTLKTALVANTSTLFVALRGMDGSGNVEIRSMGKEALVADEANILGVVPREIGVPTGLGANDSVLAWAVSADYTGPSLPDPRCGIYTRAPVLPSAEPVRILTSFTFSCMDAEVDETHVYFAIISVTEVPNGITSFSITGIGLGRVELAEPHTFESIDLGITTRDAGPRRVYLDGDGVYAVDPFTIGRISKSAFDGKHDF